jgi:hypothetical protein
MKVEAMKRLIEAASRALPDCEAACRPGEIAGWVRELPFRQIAAADHACGTYAGTRRWPRMENAIVAQLHLRAAMAADLCGMISDGPEYGALDEEEFLEMALVRFWHGQGIDWAERTYG